MLRDNENLRLRLEHGGITWLFEAHVDGLVWEKYLHWTPEKLTAIRSANLLAYIDYTIDFMRDCVNRATDLELLAQ